MHASQGSLVASAVSVGSAPYVFGSAAQKLAAPAASALVVLPGGRGSQAHACRYRPTASDVARDQRLHLRDVVVGVALALVLAAAACLAAGLVRGHASVASAAQEQVAFESVAVQSGDTLWELAEAHPVRGLTTQEVVSLVSERNGLAGSVIQPGQVIQVPRAASGL